MCVCDQEGDTEREERKRTHPLSVLNNRILEDVDNFPQLKPVQVDHAVDRSLACDLKVTRKFFLKHNKSFRWHLGDYEKHIFFSI